MEIRTASANGLFGPWGPPSSSPLVINANIQYLEYRITMTDPGSGTVSVEEVRLLKSATPTPSVTPTFSSTPSFTVSPTASETMITPTFSVSPSFTITAIRPGVRPGGFFSYPNPGEPGKKIRFAFGFCLNAEIEIFDAAGRPAGKVDSAGIF